MVHTPYDPCYQWSLLSMVHATKWCCQWLMLSMVHAANIICCQRSIKLVVHSNNPVTKVHVTSQSSYQEFVLLAVLSTNGLEARGWYYRWLTIFTSGSLRPVIYVTSVHSTNGSHHQRFTLLMVYATSGSFYHWYMPQEVALAKTSTRELPTELEQTFKLSLFAQVERGQAETSNIGPAPFSLPCY
jgi:hypothetical protein